MARLNRAISPGHEDGRRRAQAQAAQVRGARFRALPRTRADSRRRSARARARSIG